jgi:hypothetical protein
MVRAMGVFAQMVAKGALAQGSYTGDRAALERFANGQSPYVPPAAAASGGGPKPGSTITVLGTPSRGGTLDGSGSGASVAGPAATGKTLLGQ